MARLSPAERERILAAVAAAERRTSAEFSVAVAEAADFYAEIRLLVPALLAILAGPLLLAMGVVRDLLLLSAIPALVFVLGSAILLPDAVVARAVPSQIRESRARRLARSLFVELGLARPRERTGVLLFIALAEHHVEIIAGAGIAERIDAQAWQEVVDRFVAEVRSGSLASALIGAVERAAAVLAEAFPCRDSDQDEVPNRVVEL
jgi:putative membrane protein